MSRHTLMPRVLLLAGTAAGPDATALAVIVPGPDQPGQQVVQLRRLDLQPALVSARVLGEDLQDHLGPIKNSCLELALEVALLTRAEVLVADDHVEAAFQLHLTQLFDLAHADEVRRVDRAPRLNVSADDLRPRCARQVGELQHLVADQLGVRPRQEHPDQVCPLARQLGRDQSLSVLNRVIASSRRTSGAVTDSLK